MTEATATTNAEYPNELQPHQQQITDPAALKRITNALVCAIAELQQAAPAPLKSDIGDRLFNSALHIELRARSGRGLVATVRLPNGKVELPERL